jgi:hypothetical protein
VPSTVVDNGNGRHCWCRFNSKWVIVETMATCYRDCLSRCMYLST